MEAMNNTPATRVIPFDIAMNKRGNSNSIAQLMHNVIEAQRQEGWEYSHMETITYYREKGCLFFLAAPEQVCTHQLIFKYRG